MSNRLSRIIAKHRKAGKSSRSRLSRHVVSLEKLENRALLAAVTVVPDQLQVSFESTSEFDELGGVHSGVDIVAGQTGNGAEFLSGDQLTVQTQRRIDSRRGSLSFDFKPNWDWADDQHHTLLDAGNFQVFKWHKVTPNQNVFILKYRDQSGTAHQATIRTSDSDNDLFGDGSVWKDNWHHITVEWDVLSEDKVIYFDIDGKLGPNDSSNAGPNRRVISSDGIADLSVDLKIGHGQYGYAEGVLDNLIIGDVHPVFLAPMHSPTSISEHGGATTGSTTHVTGQIGDGVSITAGSTLTYSNVAGIDKDQGTFSFDFKPNWDFSDPTGPTGGRHTLLDVDAIKVFKWHKTSAFQDVLMVSIKHTDGSTTETSIRTSNGDNDLLLDGSPWKDAWHHIDVFWDATAADPFVAFMVDGKRGVTTGFKQPGVADFSTDLQVGHGSWNTGDGTFDELSVYDTSVWDSGDPIGSYTEITSGNGIWDNHETIHNSGDAEKLADSIATRQNQVFYETPALGRVFEGTTPEASQIKSTIDYDIAQGEYETLFFNLYTRTQLQDATLEVLNVTGPGGGELTGGKLHVVKNWWQGGTGPHRKLFPEFIPELLLSSDIDGDAAALETGNWTPKILPSLATPSSSVHTSLQSYTSKQFAYVLEVPDGTTAGEYTATVELKEAGSLLKTLTLRIHVEQFALADSDREYITYHQSGRSNPNSNRYVTEAVFLKELEDLKAHGLTGVINYEFDPATINTMLQQTKAAGLEKVIALRHSNTNRATIKAHFDSQGLEPWFYGKDEPNSATKIDDHINLSDDVHDDGGLIFTAIRDQYDIRLRTDPFDPGDSSSVYYDPGTTDINLDDPDVSGIEPLDMANISTSDGAAKVYFDGLASDPTSSVPDRTYYWQSLQENPNINRSMTGFFLWNTGLGGVAPYVYQDIRNNPYDDWDTWSSTTPSYRDHLTTYPSQEGPVTTMQWEAFREGIDDVRYLQTWTNYYTQLDALDPAAAATSKTVIDAVLDHYKDMSYNGTTSVAGTSAEQFASDRSIIRNEINSLIGQIHDHVDYGDAPSTYPTLLSDDGARHTAVGPQLGLSRDIDADGQPSSIADGDGGDEDGVMFGAIAVGAAAGVNIDLQNAIIAVVDAWIDFDGDGDWDPAEQILDDAAVVGGLQTLNFTVPSGAILGDTFARVRVSTSGNLAPTGFAADGEVEDYQVSILAASPVVESVVINGGETQRSAVTELVVTFDREVTAPASAFSVLDRDSLVVSDSLTVQSSVIDNKTVSVLTFAAGNLVDGGMTTLVNGDYRLQITAAQIVQTGGGASMVGDYTFGDQPTDAFFRKYGDQNGSGVVDLLDFAAFRQAFGKSSGDVGYLDELDSEGDDIIGLLDFAAFRGGFGT